MLEKCGNDPCPLVPRVEALERANEQHGNTHREVFDRLPYRPWRPTRTCFLPRRLCCNRGYVTHREGSGLVTLRGITNQCRARYKVTF